MPPAAARTQSSLWDTFNPAQCPVRVLLSHVSLGPLPSSICYEQAANGVCFLESFHRGTRFTTTFGPGRTMVSGLVSSAQCTSKYDGKPDEPFVPPSSSWMVSR